MIAPIQSLQADLAASSRKWRVELRDKKTGKTLPVLVPSAESPHVAISTAMNRAARFLPGIEWKPVAAWRTL